MVLVDLVRGLVRDDLQIVPRRNVVSRRVSAVGNDLGVESCLEIGLADEEGTLFGSLAEDIDSDAANEAMDRCASEVQ